MLRVLIVDDSMVSCKSTLAALKNDFNCLVRNSGADALAVVDDFKPEVILLDINMPGMDGFEICQKLQTLDEGQKALVVFVSGSDDINTKIKAYNCGGYDFIAKPFSAEELQKKLLNIRTLIRERDELIHRIEDTQSLALTSMKQASQYGYIMNFFKTLYQCNSVDEVAELFFEAMAHWQLNCLLALRLDRVFYFESAHIKFVSPIERKVFVALQEAGRLYEFGHRMIVNDKHASFLIKNMPDDVAFAGEVRDIAAAIIEGLEAKIIDLQRRNGLNLVTQKLTNTISNVKNGVSSHNQLISSVITDMMGTVSSSFHSLDLTESQESFFHDLFEKSGRKLMSVEEILLDIQEQLSLLSNQVTTIIEDTKAVTTAIKTMNNTEVELF